MRLGAIFQCYNTGLGNIAWGFAEHYAFEKILLVDKKPMQKFVKRFHNYRLTKSVDNSDIEWLLDGIDTLLVIETPYENRIFELARRKGIKTVFMPMYEWMSKTIGLEKLDVILCPSLATYDLIKTKNKILVDTEIPVDLSRFKPRLVKKAKTFLHNSGHGGLMDRNSTGELLKAIPMVKSDVKFIVNSQFPLPECTDERLTVNIGNYENYWDMYDKGDVYILIGKYGVAYLGIQEACASGMPIMFSDIDPFNRYLPKELLVKPSGKTGSQVGYMHLFKPEDIAKKIDEVAQMDLTVYSKDSLGLAKQWSWDNWKPKYDKILCGL